MPPAAECTWSYGIDPVRSFFFGRSTSMLTDRLNLRDIELTYRPMLRHGSSRKLAGVCHRWPHNQTLPLIRATCSNSRSAAEPGVSLRLGPHFFLARHHAVAASPAGELVRYPSPLFGRPELAEGTMAK